MPRRLGPLTPLSAKVRRLAKAVVLDAHDRAILRALLADPRTSQRGLARAVGLSPPAISDRITRLESTGVIRGYTTNVDWDLLGHALVVFIPMKVSDGEDMGRVIDALMLVRELEELHLVSGSSDLIGKFRLRDHGDLRELLLDGLWPIPGLQHIETYLSLSEMRPGHPPRAVLPPDDEDA